MTARDRREPDWTECLGDRPHRAPEEQGTSAQRMRESPLIILRLARGGSLCKQ